MPAPLFVSRSPCDDIARSSFTGDIARQRHSDLGHEVILGGARVSNPASRRVLEKCGFQWTGVGLYRVRALNSSAPVDRFRLDRGLWASLKSWGGVRVS